MALDQKPRQFLEENPFVGAVTTLRDDGSPHSTVVWVDVEDGKVSFNTQRNTSRRTSTRSATRLRHGSRS
jgi:Pyridoxamine 5'-phosphate oxidase